MDTPLPSSLPIHLLAFYYAVVAPWMSRLAYPRLHRELRKGNAAAKTEQYQRTALKQAESVCAVCAMWLFVGISRQQLGIRSPHSWIVTVGLSLAAATLFAATAVRRRPMAGEFRKKMEMHGGDLLPDSIAEHYWYAAVSIGGGISEELAYRGFLFYYLATVFPGISSGEQVLATSVIFGVGHIYKGWRGVVASGIAGVLMAILFLTTGSLVLPIVVHAAGNLRASVIFWPGVSAVTNKSIPNPM